MIYHVLNRGNGGMRLFHIDGLREYVQRGRPFGREAKVRATAARLELEFTLRGPGRPRKITINLMAPLCAPVGRAAGC